MFELKQFLRSEKGTMSVETALVFPLLLWCFGATFQFWDYFHAKSTGMRAAFTISDLLSRETNTVDTDYIDGLNTVHSYLVKSSFPVRLRVSTLRWDDADAEYKVIWSASTDEVSWPEHTDATLNDEAGRIPVLAAGDISILVETEMQYVPFLNIGIQPSVIENFMVTRPRFGPQLVWEEPDGTLIGHSS